LRSPTVRNPPFVGVSFELSRTHTYTQIQIHLHIHIHIHMHMHIHYAGIVYNFYTSLGGVLYFTTHVIQWLRFPQKT